MILIKESYFNALEVFLIKESSCDGAIKINLYQVDNLKMNYISYIKNLLVMVLLKINLYQVNKLKMNYRSQLYENLNDVKSILFLMIIYKVNK